MPSGIRLKRISDRIKQILSIALQSDVDDPRLLGVFITDVKVDRELEYASVYFSSLEGHERVKEVTEAFNHARGFLKRKLAEEIELRVIPKLRFFYDPTPEKADRIDTLLAQIRGDIPIEEEKAEEDELDE